MKRLITTTLVLAAVCSLARSSMAHCEVPCGVYGDQRRFEQMLEDQTTIAKAIKNIEELAGKQDALSKNQLVRWVNTKETHATATQHVIAQYFMTQRIKPGDNYEKKLTAAHKVMVAAMKSKQTVDSASSDALRAAILDFYRAYEGKEPNLDNQ